MDFEYVEFLFKVQFHLLNSVVASSSYGHNCPLVKLWDWVINKKGHIQC